jgi:outer membrane protein OmpA-like peptidoglycan-associated protein
MPHAACTSHRTARSFVVAAGAVFALSVGGGTVTRAHAQSVYGSMQSSVTINYSVLDHLGPAPRVPDGRFVPRVPARHPAHVAFRHTRHRHVIARRVVLHPVRRMARAQPVRRLPEVVQLGSVTIDYEALPLRVASSGPRLVLRRPGSVNVAAAASAVERPAAPLTPPAATHAAPQVAVLSRPAPRPPSLPTPVVPPAPRVATAPTPPELKRSDLSELSSLLPIGGVALAATRSPTEPLSGAGVPQSDTRVIRFTPGSAQLRGDASAMLSRVAQQLKADPSEHIALVAYASGDAAQAIEARRVSLERAVMVRAYLIQHGVDSMRIDVRALGNRVTDGGTADRVDLVTTGR